MNKTELNQLYKETNEKFIQRIQIMIYQTCGCNPKRAEEVLKECLKRNEEKMKT